MTKNANLMIVLLLMFSSGACLKALAQGDRTAPPRLEELRLRVLDERNLGLRVLVELGVDDLHQTMAYTDWSGYATFSNLLPGTYVLVVSVDGNELLRSQLAVQPGERAWIRMIRVRNVTFSDPQDTVSLNDLRTPRKAYQLYLAGIDAIRAGDPNTALRRLDRALRLYPQHSKSQNARGVVLHMTRMPLDAEEAFRRAIELDANALEPRLNLGKLLMEFNRLAEAREQLQQAFQVGAENLAAVELLLESMLLTHEEKSAVSLVESLHRKGTTHPARLHLKIASALTEHGMIDLAVEQCAFVAQDSPTAAEQFEAHSALLEMQSRKSR